MGSFLEQPNNFPLCETIANVLTGWYDSRDKGFSFRSAGLQLVIAQLDDFCTKSTEQRVGLVRKHDELKQSVDKNGREVADHIERVEVIRQQLVEAEKQLASSRQKLETVQEEERKCFEQQRILKEKAEELRKCREFYKDELDKTTSVINQLSSKLKEHRCVSCLAQEEVLLFLQELEIPNPIRDLFKKNQIGGKALELVSDHNLQNLGMSDINLRKGLLHAICNVRVHGCIHVAPPLGASGDALAAWWNADEVSKWLEEQGFDFPSLKGLTGRTLIHLSEDDISQFGILMGPALELKSKCETLKQSFFSFSQQQSAHFSFILLYELKPFQAWFLVGQFPKSVFHQIAHQNTFAPFHTKSCKIL